MIQEEGHFLMAKTPLIYAIGLDSLTARAVYTDLSGAVIQRRRPLSVHGPHGRGGRQPDLILMDLAHADPEAELAAAWTAWGEDVLIVGLSRDAPLARIWQHQGAAVMVEIGPGFLRPFLRWPTQLPQDWYNGPAQGTVRPRPS